MAELHSLPIAPRAPAPRPPKRTRRPSQAWRQRYASEAAGEVAAIGALLQRECPEPDEYLVRGLALRLETLGSVLMQCQDEHEVEENVGGRLFGEETARAMRKGQ